MLRRLSEWGTGVQRLRKTTWKDEEDTDEKDPLVPATYRVGDRAGMRRKQSKSDNHFRT